MNDAWGAQRPWADGLIFQALLYTSGDLEEQEAAAFEQRLGEDQTAREAVSEAVQLALVSNFQTPAAPDRTYRERVRQRLQPHRRFWHWLVGQRIYPGHPALWGTLGATVVLLVFGFLNTPAALAPPPAADPAAAAPDRAPADKAEVSSPPATAKVWADVNDHTNWKQKHDFLSPRRRQTPNQR
jgi:hypothetical protein